MFDAVGLDTLEERMYRLLVGVIESDAATLAGTLDVTAEEAQDVLDSLYAKGLVSQHRHGEKSRFTVTAPDIGLGQLLLSGQEALERARTAVAHLTDEYRSSVRRRDATQLVEVVTGAPAIRQQLRNLQLGTREEALWFCRSGHVAMPSEENSEEFEMLARGVRYQVIYEQALLEEPGMIGNVAGGIRKGEQARATPHLPVRMVIADRKVALCPLVRGGDGPGEPTAALVRDSNLLAALIALFESYWANASPLHVFEGSQGTALQRSAPERTTNAVGDDDLYLLSLLVAGVSDKAIATALSISQRTVQRRVKELMDRVGAETRMQLAWQAARHGWV
ncbi:response regulator transcription factor [Phytoactinopolyspora alkaliphila]|uniref:Response regulator transcription factor n=1 Tax=Phytoactinopolyspora alkaliphila TaxID=1783498 RepID=A0A6N9YTW1_9ACTN|nr:response regulator transcription factor [Phytoactinopolyspora alkaliphila]